jgi:nucleotide-binding universal stress UspA family protein
MSNMSCGEPFSHILCWVDGSDEACRAAEHAACLARSLGAKLSYLAVGTGAGRDEGFDAYARIEGVSEPMPPVLKGDVHACLEQAMSIAAKIGIAGAARLVRSGDDVMAICDAARTQDADLIVIRKRKSGLVERLLGASASDTLANRCGFAVLSVG